MKTLLNLLCATAFTAAFLISCNSDDYDTIQSYDRIKIDSVDIPNDTMAVNSIQTIRTYSTYASNCEGFYGYDYRYTGDFERDITSYAYRTDGNCGSAPYTAFSNINFRPVTPGNYSLRFWQGGNNWMIKNIVVE